MDFEITAKKACGIADEKNHIETYKILIRNAITRAANKGLYKCFLSFEGKLPITPLQSWLYNLGYAVSFTNSNFNTILSINWEEKIK